MNKEEVLFPFDSIRFIQDDLIKEIQHCVKNRENIIVHAPTGLGKTVSAIGPALKKAEEEELTVFFLTSRHTQHKIALETIKAIKQEYNLNIPVIDIIGKQHMCLIKGSNLLTSGEFAEFCRKTKEDKNCKYFNNINEDGKFTLLAKKALEDIEDNSPLDVNECINVCKENSVCPYEISMILAKKAKVIVADYYYMFNPSIMNNFLNKIGKDIDECIVIVDEAHNLPERIRKLMSNTISESTINGAKKEADELKNDECHEILNRLEYWIKELLMDMDEVIVKKGEFDPGKFIDAIELFERLAEITRDNDKRSYLGIIANFLMSYTDEEGYVNIIRKNYDKNTIEFKHSCLDPSLISKPILNNAYSSIVMSGTLEPIDMFKEILGLKGEAFEFPSPFPARNKLNLIVPETTTKFSERGVNQYNKIASNLAKMCNKIPGNTIIFFPSYYIRDQIYHKFSEMCEKTTFSEVAKMSKTEKEVLLDKFKSYKETGAVLLAAASGNFGEGVDLPGDLLKGVIVVGLPLNKPSLETSSLINYYNQKYPGKGWDYGYTLPAFAKILQNAGRCIRSETDKGVIIFMDQRFVWANYNKCFSEDYIVSLDFEQKIQNFFDKHS